MSNIIIKVENLSKQYRLGEIGTGTISHDLNRWWARFRGKEDPFLKFGESNDRTIKGDSNYVWALRDINFEVRKGEVLGIIGRNGAGKSTLLKILSKTTTPTKGNIKVKGRIASLLEVGTGFHPEMTGRENIFLNGAILGMTRKEIRAKFDEIVDFAGVEKYIDTPVKRYSSGMYVRLAFAVAAHLEPEILIVDEVLAVGDAEFQKKCLGKMKDVSINDGRTVLFVSHNMEAIRSLCEGAIFLDKGFFKIKDKSDKVVEQYLNYGLSQKEVFKEIDYDDIEKIVQRQGNHTGLDILKVGIYNEEGLPQCTFNSSEKFFIKSKIKIKDFFTNFRIIHELKIEDHSILLSQLSDSRAHSNIFEPGVYETVLEVPANVLAQHRYSLNIIFYHVGRFNIILENFFTIDITYNNPNHLQAAFEHAYLRPMLNWQLRNLQ